MATIRSANPGSRSRFATRVASRPLTHCPKGCRRVGAADKSSADRRGLGSDPRLLRLVDGIVLCTEGHCPFAQVAGQRGFL